MRKQIVHNAHVVAELESRGAVFVEELDEVPEGATVIFSAHGVSPAVRSEAAERGLDVIDATCPLVAKVHAEARRFAAAGFDIVLVGHEGHEEVDGTLGEAPDHIQRDRDAEEVDRRAGRGPRTRSPTSTQTTLAVDETGRRRRRAARPVPGAVGPPSSDICYATQNRQDAVRALAAELRPGARRRLAQLVQLQPPGRGGRARGLPRPRWSRTGASIPTRAGSHRRAGGSA